MAKNGKLRIAAVSDIHYGRHSHGTMQEILTRISNEADVFLLCGDLTDYGLTEEAEILANDLRANIKIPMIGVLGNHDFESGQPDDVRQVIEEAGVIMLDGECTEVEGVGFAGICGFGGGFGSHMLNAWGESLIKEFVQEAVNESLKLEQALARLETDHRVVLMHYSPIRETVEGEPLEIFPFLGSSRLEGPLNQYDVEVAFHGHAHHGCPEGHTSKQVPIYNVSMPLMRRAFSETQPYRIYEVDL